MTTAPIPQAKYHVGQLVSTPDGNGVVKQIIPPDPPYTQPFIYLVEVQKEYSENELGIA